jgi:hypothetical protein
VSSVRILQSRSKFSNFPRKYCLRKLPFPGFHHLSTILTTTTLPPSPPFTKTYLLVKTTALSFAARSLMYSASQILTQKHKCVTARQHCALPVTHPSPHDANSANPLCKQDKHPPLLSYINPLSSSKRLFLLIFSALKAKIKCSICSAQLNPWRHRTATYRSFRITLFFVRGRGLCACAGSESGVSLVLHCFQVMRKFEAFHCVSC